ncbi:MAG: aminotransferase class V-fold PLP-dependent enzyme [Roseiflexaceae bacterium]|nr:aminotransferase class V-fold PLP-dependent enzyme [Roseiflexaceae bacterium]
MEDLIYLDHAATTPVHAQVLEAMWPFFAQQYGNASASYPLAEQARAAADWAHAEIARQIGARPGEIVITSGGSESDNLAIKGVAFASRERGDHIITTQIEHHAVLRACQYLERSHGFRVTYLPVDHHGLVDLAALEQALDQRTMLVSVMLANNEVGTIQPVAEVAKLTRPRGIPLHCDAVQAIGQLPVDVATLGVDLLTISAHKCYGPKGVGALYVRRGTPLDPLIHGGHQERERRAGTENVAGMIGMARTLQLLEIPTAGAAPLARRFSAATLGVQALRDQLIAGVLRNVSGATLTGHPTERLANNASFCFRSVAGEAVLVALADHGIACSSGSACAAGEQEPSHVLTAMGIEAELAQTAVRFSLGLSNTPEQIDRVITLLAEVVGNLR